MFGKIARSLGVVALAAAPFSMLGTQSASATGGCAVDNASTSFTLDVHVEVPPVPPAVTVSFTSFSCSYVSGGGTANWHCQLAGGRCQVFVNGLERARCITYALSNCGGSFTTNAGDVVELQVAGGHGEVADAV